MAWMLYGATGYTGRLIAEEALRRGARPILAGRTGSKLNPLARRLGLEHRVAPLDDDAGLRRILAGVDLVVHVAGPFRHTAAGMLRACLATGVSYADISGELPTFTDAFGLDREARERGIAVVPGIGFDVVASDCLAAYVAERAPGATRLEIAVAATRKVSGGTLLSALEALPGGGRVRRDDAIRRWPLGKGVRRIPFADTARLCLPAPLADVESAARTTRVPDVTTYLAVPGPVAAAAAVSWPVTGVALPAAASVLRVPGVRAQVARVLDRLPGPDEEHRRTGRAQLWARATDGNGRAAEACLETVEPYEFTARCVVAAAERLVADRASGAATPALALGTDFVLGIEGTRRLDR